MRELKFRAWKEDVKEMYYEFSHNDFDGKKIVHHQDINELFEILQKVYILMQYTGLKDKKGKEIYEGDIVKWKDTDAGVVNWGYDGWQIDYDKGRKQFLSDHWILSEVIGNIYENKELLTNK